MEPFDAYYQRDYREVVGLAYVLTGSRWAAEDLAHDALAEAHKRWSTIGNYDDPAAWVRRVLCNKHISRGRRLRSETKALVKLRARRGHPVEISARTGEVWAAVRRLPRRQAQAIALFYWEDRPVAEIADIMGTGIETTKTHLKRGRAALAEALRDHHPNAIDGEDRP